MTGSRRDQSVFAFQPTSRGFGFAMLEGFSKLVDWGSYGVSQDRNTRCVKKLQRLLTEFEPDVIVCEDVAQQGTRRKDRVRGLLAEVSSLVPYARQSLFVIPRLELVTRFERLAATNKHQIAVRIVELFPELELKLPPPRKLWMSQDERYGIFDAAAFAITYYTGGAVRAIGPLSRTKAHDETTLGN